MSSIPVRRATRLARPIKDIENANARQAKTTTRSKLAAGAAPAATSVTTRATASTAASKAKSVVADQEKEAGVKRKREVLVEVTHTNKANVAAVPAAKGKDAATKETEVPNPKAVIKPPTRRLVAGSSRRLVARIVPEAAATTTTETEPSVKSKPQEQMEIDARADEDARRVFKRRHTDEKKATIDESQAEADSVAAELEAVEPSSANAQLWEDLDEGDWDDPIMVSEYVADVCVYFKEIELETMPNPDYMQEQAEITWEHRGVLIDWLLQLHARFNLVSESLFLTVNVIDRFLASRPISIQKLQLVGLACFFIATKYEETYAPGVKDLAYFGGDQYSTDELLKAERYILKTIGWDLRAPGPMGWLRRGSKADDCEVHARTISKYLLEIGLVERRLIGFVPSLLSAASLWLARLTLGREEWTANLEHYTTYSEKEIIPVATIMVEYIITDPIQHESLYKKYAHKRYYRCSTYIMQWCMERWPENGIVDLKKDLPDIKQEIRRHREKQAEAAAEQEGGGEDNDS